MKPRLEIIEKDDTHVIYHMWEDIGDLDLYERAKAKDRFLKSESKVMEKVLESDLRNFLSVFGIIPYDTSESALKLAFDTLNAKGKQIVIVDRNKNNTSEEIVGVSDNHMTIVIDRYYVMSIAMEIKVVDL